MPSTCEHCGKPLICQQRRFCTVACANHRSRWGEEKCGAREPNPLPARLPGEPAYRCVWCGRYTCHGPLRRCGECDREYEAAVVGMPECSEGAVLTGPGRVEAKRGKGRPMGT